MNSFLHRIFKIGAYTAAGIVIMLAIAVGLFRLFLPRLPEYQEDIKSWASTAVGMQVEFSGMDARWGLSGPEIDFYDAELIRPGSQARALAAEEVGISVALASLVFDGTLVVDRIVIRDTSVELRQRDDGAWQVQGVLADELLAVHTGGERRPQNVEVIGEDIQIIVLQPGDERPRFFEIPRTTVSVDENRLAVSADIRLPDDLGRQLDVSAVKLFGVSDEDHRWDINVEAADVDFAGWSNLQRTAEPRLLSGQGDIDLSIAYANGKIQSASADVDLSSVSLEANALFDIGGRFELNVADDGWLVAAENFQLTTADNSWPEASLRAEFSTDDSGEILMTNVRASYLNLDDVGLLVPLLTDEQKQQLASFEPSGIVTELTATVADINSESPRFEIAAELASVGIAADGKRPGIRGFSGVLRANRLGGRIEIRSTDMTVELPEYLAEPVDVDSADGTVIWRSSDSSTTVLSDSIRIQNEVFDSRTNVQLVFSSEGSSPVIDLASTWSVADVSIAKRFIPQKVVKPKLYNWFQSSLVKGSIPSGTTRLYGPLDEFPFENDEGQLRVEASVRDLTFKYHPKWPATESSEMAVVLDNSRLYSVDNQSTSFGNQTIDAEVEIANLRDPVLTIKSFSTGTLEAIRAFSLQSPINDVLGGQLEGVSASGDATLKLDLTVPLKDAKRFEFESRVRSSNGTLAIAGFPARVTDLVGEVTLTRDTISSDSLGARFLGQPVAIDLSMSEDPRFSVVATSKGRAGADGIVGELGAPLDGLISGAANYESRILFPRGKQEAPAPLTIQIDSDLEGMALALPEPVGKSADESLPLRADIRFLPGGEIIESAGFAQNGLAWKIAFNRAEGSWDFDRGVVSMGSNVTDSAETRGLHIRGNTSTVRLEDWLDVSRSGDKQVGTAERIRSIDLVVDDLYAVGQHFQGHQIRVDRSARDWLVQIDGDDAVGSIFVPYDFDSDRAMVVEMERLRLPGDDEATGNPADLDPRKLPPITITADEFALGDRNFGAVDIRIERVEDGLEATTIKSKDDTFEFVGNARWVADASDPFGSRTSVTATLASNDVVQTMTRLNFAPGIDSQQMNALLDLTWSGPPRAEFLDVLDGEVQVNFGSGQLEEVEPGVGRVFGLMSIVALPKRLSLDFRDVFSKGFGFDEISGTFRISKGESYTCDLSLKGPAADIGIVGRASLAKRDYDQTAIVSANVGNTLPIVGAVVAGPQVAAALLIFSQIFKKPLQEVGQVYYSISGSWDEPTADSTNSADFAAHSELAGCLRSAQ